MSAISPIVGISKIISQYSTVIVGFNGVLYDGKQIKTEAVKALIKIHELGKNIILLSNADMRIAEVLKILDQHKVPIKIFSLIMTAGEMVYALLRGGKKFSALGKSFFCLGDQKRTSFLENIGLQSVSDVNKADFIYVGGLKDEYETIEKYTDIMQIAASLNLPMLCVGNDIYTCRNGEVCEGNGAFAEQYAMMGGKIVTFGKPDIAVIKYVLESFSVKNDNVLVVGDSLQTDVKMANLYGADSLLVTFGIHKEFLGGGYIPDLQKAVDLSSDYGVYPKYLISELRW